MATWVTHLMIADQVLKETAELDRRGFCVGNIAPDCNIENEDWTSYIPSRDITHWMSGGRKAVSGCDSFFEEYILKRGDEIKSKEQYSFLLGYYAHLITDVAYLEFVRDENRVKAVWDRIKADVHWSEKAKGYPEDWDSIKKIIPKDLRMNEIYTMEAEYLKEHQDSGYLTEIIPLREFPDYIDYLPHGCIVRKIGVMGWIPEADESIVNPIVISREEYKSFVDNTVKLVLCKFREKRSEYYMVKGVPFDVRLPENTVTRAEAMRAFEDLRAQASELPEMTLEEIDAEISAARAERKKR